MRSLVVVLLLTRLGAAQDPSPSGTEFFEKKIRPVLVARCIGCHGPDPKKQKGGLALDTREGLLKGGSAGPAVVPGDAERSLLVKAVRYGDPDLRMPPPREKSRLSAQEISDINDLLATLKTINRR